MEEARPDRTLPNQGKALAVQEISVHPPIQLVHLACSAIIVAVVGLGRLALDAVLSPAALLAKLDTNCGFAGPSTRRCSSVATSAAGIQYPNRHYGVVAVLQDMVGYVVDTCQVKAAGS